MAVAASGVMTAPRQLRFRLGVFYAVLLPVLALSIIAATAIGSTPLAWQTILHVLAVKMLPDAWVNAQGLSETDQVIVWLIRLPRVLVAACVGAGLSVSGAIMQALFRNPLAEPSLTGIGPGAVLGAVIAFVAGWGGKSVVSVPLLAMAGALLALGAVYAMSTRGGVTPLSTLLLAGIATGSLLSALSSLLLSINIVNWQTAQDILFWMMGGLDARTWTHFWLCAPFVALGLGLALLQSRELDVLMQGEEAASALGVNVEMAKRLLILTAAILTGASVAVAGLIGFVGLVVPHGVRLVLGPANRAVLPASALTGAAFLILCDLAARTLHRPTEIRLGIITALCGGPFFLALLLRRYREASL